MENTEKVLDTKVLDKVLDKEIDKELDKELDKEIDEMDEVSRRIKALEDIH